MDAHTLLEPTQQAGRPAADSSEALAHEVPVDCDEQQGAVSLCGLDQRLIAAHVTADVDTLAILYANAGHRFEASGDIDAACFYLTHAFVFALEAGSAEMAHVLETTLRRYDRI